VSTPPPGENEGRVDAVLKAGDTVGGVFELSRTCSAWLARTRNGTKSWTTNRSGRMSIQAVKGVEIGAGIMAAGSLGSEVQMRFPTTSPRKKFARSSNRAGGLEGGITNGEDLVVRGYLKPISTCSRALRTADMVTKDRYRRPTSVLTGAWCPLARRRRSDVALVLADAFLQKFGGDSLRRCAGILRGMQTNPRLLNRPLRNRVARNRTAATPNARNRAPRQRKRACAQNLSIVKYGDQILEKASKRSANLTLSSPSSPKICLPLCTRRKASV